MKGELPLRVVDQPGGAVIRCLCGRELAAMRRGLATGRLAARSGSGINRGQVHLSPDLTIHGLLVMVAHAMSCEKRSDE